MLDNNVLASDFGLEQIEEIVRMGIAVDFNQGLDARKACNDALRKLGVIPFAQPYRDFDNNIEPTKEQKRLARWCNHKAIFKSVEFKNYKG